MIDINFRNGDRLGLPYGYLVAVELSGDRLELRFASVQAVIEGRNLGGLYDAVVRHTVTNVYELGDLDTLPESSCAIAKIVVARRDADAAT